MSRGERDCPIPGCTNSRNPDHMMCPQHWRRVPRLLNYAVFDSWRHYCRVGTLAARKKYYEVRAQAIEAVCLKLGVAVPESERA